MIIIRVLRRVAKKDFPYPYRAPLPACTKRKISLVVSGAGLAVMTSTINPPSRFEEFVELCRKEGLLERPAELAPEDTIDGINDTSTLKYVPLYNI